jgi:hypothetical protein
VEPALEEMEKEPETSKDLKLKRTAITTFARWENDSVLSMQMKKDGDFDWDTNRAL